MQTKPPVDPKVAAVLASLFAVLGVFGVFTKLGLDADEVAILVGALGALGTTVRATLLSIAHRRHRRSEGAIPQNVLRGLGKITDEEAARYTADDSAPSARAEAERVLVAGVHAAKERIDRAKRSNRITELPTDGPGDEAG